MRVFPSMESLAISNATGNRNQMASSPHVSIHLRRYSWATFATDAEYDPRRIATPVIKLDISRFPASGGTASRDFWCARRDSNPHDVTHCHLKAARLPIPPRALKEIGTELAPDRSTAPM